MAKVIWLDSVKEQVKELNNDSLLYFINRHCHLSGNIIVIQCNKLDSNYFCGWS